MRTEREREREKLRVCDAAPATAVTRPPICDRTTGGEGNGKDCLYKQSIAVPFEVPPFLSLPSRTTDEPIKH